MFPPDRTKNSQRPKKGAIPTTAPPFGRCSLIQANSRLCTCAGQNIVTPFSIPLQLFLVFSVCCLVGGCSPSGSAPALLIIPPLPLSFIHRPENYVALHTILLCIGQFCCITDSIVVYFEFGIFSKYCACSCCGRCNSVLYQSALCDWLRPVCDDLLTGWGGLVGGNRETQIGNVRWKGGKRCCDRKL